MTKYAVKVKCPKCDGWGYNETPQELACSKGSDCSFCHGLCYVLEIKKWKPNTIPCPEPLDKPVGKWNNPQCTHSR